MPYNIPFDITSYIDNMIRKNCSLKYNLKCQNDDDLKKIDPPLVKELDPAAKEFVPAFIVKQIQHPPVQNPEYIEATYFTNLEKNFVKQNAWLFE